MSAIRSRFNRSQVAALFVLGALPLVLLSYLAISLSDQAVTDETRKRLEATASVSSGLIQQEMDAAGNLVEAFARRPNLINDIVTATSTESARSMVQPHLDDLATLRPGTAVVVLETPSGDVIATSPAAPPLYGQNFATRDYFLGVQRTHHTYISSAFITAIAGHPLAVAVAAPIAGPADHPGTLGILVLAYRLDALQQFVSSFAASQGVSLVVTDQQGIEVAAPGTADGHVGALVSLLGDRDVHRALSGQSGVDQVGTGAGQREVAYAPVHGLGWAVTASAPDSVALAPVRQLTASVLVITAILLLILLAAVLVIRRLQLRLRLIESRESLERDRLMTQLQESNTGLEEANRHKTAFLANVSHELRTPLSAIIGFTDLLLDATQDRLDTEQREDLVQIQRSGRSLLELINDLLDLSKIEAGEMTMELQSVSLRAALDHSASSFQRLAGAKGLEFEVEIPAGPVLVRADPLRLRQVLSNLLANAVKFTAEGSIRVRVDEVGRMAQVSVADTGIGIPIDAHEAIFQEFRQADNSTSRRYGGTGLGLAISRRLVELMQGQIGMESVEGQGSRFWFTIPRQGLFARAAAAHEPTEDVRAKSRVILVIDDDQGARRLVVRRLADAGFDCVEANNADEGLRLARGLRPAAVILDIKMPGRDGWTVLAELHADAGTAEVPVLVLSVVEGREIAAEMGARAFLQKPAGQEELVAAVRALLPGDFPAAEGDGRGGDR